MILALLSRTAPEAPPEAAFAPVELAVLDRQARGPAPASAPRALSHYLLAVAKLGGYLARVKDPPPGNRVAWRDLVHLAARCEGSELDKRLVDSCKFDRKVENFINGF